MELREFIKEVSLEIIQGVTDTQDEINKKGIKSIVNPTSDQSLGNETKGKIYDFGKYQKIDIEAALITREVKKGGISVQVLSGSYSGDKESVSKVKFSLPILFPPVNLPDDFFKET
ncbi:hypothetical protein [Mesonia aestuariivivens]|uniref:HK97 gp10 family phage protein n=1 Tax=Mesonia aestuariivivens TaxID=2796128 RepID=A0ABS6W0D7_9FLAO|nr:hypothetical protein [Mesonia aestuariivivens]MBW2961306.1 hypothetical protein [Mesonia aestuariivivens]